MTAVASVEVPAEQFALGSALASMPDVHVRLDRIVPLGETFAPYFWLESDTVETVEAALRETTELAAFDVAECLDGEVLVRAEWEHRPGEISDAVADHGGVVLEAFGEAGSWRLLFRFPDRESLAACYEACRELEMSFELLSVHDTRRPDSGTADLTDCQREALRAAAEMGYFEVPRRATLTDLAATLGVSDSAVSQRLRRGTGAVVTEALDGLDTQRLVDDGGSRRRQRD
jgi:predicted DNA binding protein